MAIQFPIGEVRWAELEKARGWLDGVLGEEVFEGARHTVSV